MGEAGTWTTMPFLKLDVEKLVSEFGGNLQGVLAGGDEPRLSSNAA